MRVETLDQNTETQVLDLRQMAAQRGYEIVAEFTDRIIGIKAKRAGLDQMMASAKPAATRSDFGTAATRRCGSARSTSDSRDAPPCDKAAAKRH